MQGYEGLFSAAGCRRGKEPCMEEIKVRETGSQREEDKHNQEFIMLPTVDFCFKELMKNPRSAGDSLLRF